MRSRIRKIQAVISLLGIVSGVRFGVESTRCPDNSYCLYNASCVVNEDKTRTYGCDCNTTLGVQSYAGFSCEYEAKDYCFFNVPDGSKQSFCTNGKCREKHQVGDGEELK